VDIAREIFARLNKPVEINIYPYERCLYQMKTGERDVLLMAKKNPEREQFMLFTDVVASDPQLFYFDSAHKPAFQWTTWSDLKGYKVGVVRGFDYGPFRSEAKKHGVHVEEVSDELQNIRKLMAGRLDLIILNRSTAVYFKQSNPASSANLKSADKAVTNAQFHYALSKKGAAAPLLAQMNDAIRQMKADGTIQRIIGKEN